MTKDEIQYIAESLPPNLTHKDFWELELYYLRDKKYPGAMTAAEYKKREGIAKKTLYNRLQNPQKWGIKKIKEGKYIFIIKKEGE